MIDRLPLDDPHLRPEGVSDEVVAATGKVTEVAEARVRDALVAGRRHVFESELKEQRRSRGRRHHEARPAGLQGGPVDERT